MAFNTGTAAVAAGAELPPPLSRQPPRASGLAMCSGDSQRSQVLFEHSDTPTFPII